VPPGEFIPIAEDSGLIGAIDAWVLEQACAQMVRWLAEGSALQFVAVNVSSRLFSRGELDRRVERVLRETGLAPARLELEVTESAVMDNPERAQELLSHLQGLGVRLAIDDFGTGYSSLARLKRLPVHKLKLDQSFVSGLPQDGEDAAIARAVVTLGQSLGLRVLAEGIETAEQAAYLREIGCNLGQGYWFGRPQPAEQLLAMSAHACRAPASELGDRHLGGFDEGDHLAAHPQFQLTHGAGGDHRGDDTGGGLHVDLRQHVADHDFLDGALELVAYVDGFDGHAVAPFGSQVARMHSG